MTDIPLEAGDVLLCRSDCAVGRLIRFGERVRYHGWAAALARVARSLVGLEVVEDRDDPAWSNHAAVYVGGGLLVEALAAGLVVTPAGRYGPGCFRVARLAQVRPGVTPGERAAAVEFARAQQQRHDRYGWLSIASIVLQLVTPVRLDVSWDGALICSAFAAQCWEHAGVTLPTRSSLTTMPADLAAMVDGQPIP